MVNIIRTWLIIIVCRCAWAAIYQPENPYMVISTCNSLPAGGLFLRLLITSKNGTDSDVFGPTLTL